MLRVWLLVAGMHLLYGCAAIPAISPYGSPVQGTSSSVFKLAASADNAYQQHRWHEAESLYQKLVTSVPDDAYSWFRLGNTLAQQGNYPQAIISYQESIQRNPGLPKPWFNLSTTYLLSAQMAMHESWKKLRVGDPARSHIKSRMNVLSELIHDRIVESDNSVPTTYAR